MMTLEEWSTCKKAWWIYAGGQTILDVAFTSGPMRDGHSVLRRGSFGNTWRYFNDPTIGHWFATEAEAQFYREVLR